MKQVQQKNTKKVPMGKLVRDASDHLHACTARTHVVVHLILSSAGCSALCLLRRMQLTWHGARTGPMLPTHNSQACFFSHARGDFSIRRPAWKVHSHGDREPSLCMHAEIFGLQSPFRVSNTKGVFSSENFWLLITVPLSFVFDKNCLIMDYLGLKDSSC